MKEMVEFVEWLKNFILEAPWSTISIYKARNKVFCYIDGALEREISLPKRSEEVEEEAEAE